MAVEVDHRDGSICAVDGSQQREGDGVVTAQRDDTGKCLALLRGAELVGVGGGGTREDAVMTLLDLVKSPSVVVPEVSSLIIQGIQSTLELGRTYEVTGISPQSSTVAQLSKGLVSRGTLYPPLKPHLVRSRVIRYCTAKGGHAL